MQHTSTLRPRLLRRGPHHTSNNSSNPSRLPGSQQQQQQQQQLPQIPRGGIPSGFSNALLVLTAIAAVVGVVGVGVSTGLWAYNVHLIQDTDKAQQSEINDLNATIMIIVDILGNGTIFIDDEWTMVNAVQQSRQFMLNASLISLGTKRNYAGPDADGIFLLDTTFVPVFEEQDFAITAMGDPTTRLELDLGMLTAGVVRILQVPNKNGIIATLQDVVAVAGNTSVFLDSAFRLENDPDTTKGAMFNLTFLTSNTNRTYWVPDLSGILVLTTGNQTISDKTIDNTNAITVLDINLAIESSSSPGDLVMFDASGISTNRILTIADDDITIVGRAGTSWSVETLGLDGGTGTFNSIAVISMTQVDRFFRFRSGGGGIGGFSGIQLSSFDTDNWFLTADPNDGGDLKLFWNNTLPSANNELGDVILSVDDASKDLRLHQSGDDTIYADLDVSALTAPRTASFPDTDCVFLCESAVQNISNKDITDPSNTVRATELALNDSTSVDISASGAPSAGQVLTATSASTAAWVGPPVPTGTVLDYAGTTEPDGWLFCYGQEINRTTFAALFAVVGTTYGAGDGSTTFNLPDLRGRAIAGKDDMGGVSANRLTGTSGGVNGDGLGNSGGSQQHTLTTGQMPSHQHDTTDTARTVNNVIDIFGSGGATGWAFNGDASGTFNDLTGLTGSGNAHNNVQPTFILNKIIRT